jgi:hypothetical protein
LPNSPLDELLAKVALKGTISRRDNSRRTSLQGVREDGEVFDGIGILGNEFVKGAPFQHTLRTRINTHGVLAFDYQINTKVALSGNLFVFEILGNLVWARTHTVFATDAYFSIDLNCLIFGYTKGSAWTGDNTRWVLAVIASRGMMIISWGGKRTCLICAHPPEYRPNSEVVFVLAGNLTSTATDAASAIEVKAKSLHKNSRPISRSPTRL